MEEYKVGYKRPPLNTRFRKGECPNPNGRGRRVAVDLKALADSLLFEKVSFRKNGRIVEAPRLELAVQKLVSEASQGDVASADGLLRLYSHAKRYGDIGPMIVDVFGALPQFGQEDEKPKERFVKGNPKSYRS